MVGDIGGDFHAGKGQMKIAAREANADGRRGRNPRIETEGVFREVYEMVTGGGGKVATDRRIRELSRGKIGLPPLIQAGHLLGADVDTAIENSRRGGYS